MRQVTDDWWIGVNETYKSRERDGDLVFYKPGRSVFVSLFAVEDEINPKAFLEQWVVDRGDENAEGGDRFDEASELGEFHSCLFFLATASSRGHPILASRLAQHVANRNRSHDMMSLRSESEREVQR